jgi:SulP family sulfate permease
MKLQKQGYAPKSLVTDLLLGIFDGLDNALWSYGFATILFAGTMTKFLPVGVAVVLTGWALLGVFVALTSKSKTHLISVDEQAVVILAGVGSVYAAQAGTAGSAQAFSTMLALMAASSLAVALSFILIGHFRLARLLELLPFPVICGFMAGVGWLFLDAAVMVTVDHPISPSLPESLREGDGQWKLLATLLGGLFLVVFMSKIHRAWAFPVAVIILFLLFFGVITLLGISEQELLARGWYFDVASAGLAPDELLSLLSFSSIDFAFIASAAPEILTIVFLALLSTSLSLTALTTSGRFDLDSSGEIKNQGYGNLLCAAVGCPPGYTDVAGSVLYTQFGASSRIMPIISSLVCLGVALAGTWLIAHLPKVLVGATILLFSYRLLHEWLFQRVRGFQPVDFLVVCIILAMVIFVGFMVGILTGVVLTLVLFVLRYSMISAIHGRYSLREYRSSVERPLAVNHVLDEHGVGSLVYTLRGFLFFGTANAILDRIKRDLGDTGQSYSSVLLDFKRVTGMDISALNTFVQVKAHCESLGVRVLYSAVPIDVQIQISSLEAVSTDDGSPLFFDEIDYAVEYMEDQLLMQFAPETATRTVRQQLEQILEHEERIDIIMKALKRVDCPAGQALFVQGDLDDGFYVLESGSLSAYIDGHGYVKHRVKKFGSGSLIGELSMFMPSRKRTASVVADVDSVLYFLSSDIVNSLDLQDTRLSGAVFELVARALGMRISYMNQRLMLELE